MLVLVSNLVAQGHRKVILVVVSGSEQRGRFLDQLAQLAMLGAGTSSAASLSGASADGPRSAARPRCFEMAPESPANRSAWSATPRELAWYRRRCSLRQGRAEAEAAAAQLGGVPKVIGLNPPDTAPIDSKE